MEIKIPIERLRERGLFLATPMFGGLNSGMFAKSCIDLSAICTAHGIPLQVYFLFNESLIPRARNYSCDEFMRSSSEHMIFIDADIGFNPQDVIAMMALQAMDPEKYNIIGGPYPKKCISWEKIKSAVDRGVADEDPNVLDRYVGDFVFNPKSGQTSIRIDEPVEVLEIGTGFMMVTKQAMQKFADSYPQYKYLPDHVRTEFFDGSREITQFFQAEIDTIDYGQYYVNELKRIGEKGITDTKEIEEIILKGQELAKEKSRRYLSEDYWFCLPSQSKIETEDGLKSIKSIVDTCYRGKVKSLDENNNIVWKNITNSWSRFNGKRNQIDSKKKWVKLFTSSNNNKRYSFISTEDHNCKVTDNILDRNIDIFDLPAKKTKSKFVIKNVNDRNNPLYNSDQLSALIGTVIGDGYINKNGQLSITHSLKQEKYLDFKQELFKGKSSIYNNTGFGKEYLKKVLISPVNEQLKELREILYIDGKKTLKNILPLLNEISLAFWYMDDGSLSKSGELRISTESFNYEDHLKFVEFMNKKYSIKFLIKNSHRMYKGERREYNYLTCTALERDKFLKLISPYIHSSMKYKLPKNYDNYAGSYNFDCKTLDFSATKVLDIIYLPKFSSRLYDIEVEDTHNFVANDFYVHNCQRAQEINLKTWLCPWMKLQHVGSYIFGGSLADLAAIGAAATANPEQLGGKKKKK